MNVMRGTKWNIFLIYVIILIICEFCTGEPPTSQDATKCHPNFFECANGMCIKSHFKCDHHDDCGDDSDESECPLITLDVGPKKCPDGEYLCKSPPRCFTFDDLCSDLNECNDYDETICPKCQPHKFKCHDGSHCVLKEYLCDGTKDCEDKSDELNCNDTIYKCREEADHFLCEDHSDCILADYYVCNGHADCDDGSDEKNNCEKLCEDKCSPYEICLPQGSGVTCVCRDGYKFDKESDQCVVQEYCKVADIDRPCSQDCIETINGPICRCHHGYVLGKDGQSCKVTGPLPVLYVSTANEIYQRSPVETSPEHPTVVLDGLHGVKCLALDSDQRRIFWSETGPTGQPEVYFMSIEGGEKTKQVLASFGLQNPESVAFDYITKNVYILDAGVPAILVCELQQKYCVTVFNSSILTSPGHVALYPEEGVLYYTEKAPAIMKASMDGQRIESFVTTGIIRPTSLLIDLTTKRLYWIDSYYDKVFKIDLDGSNKMVVRGHTITSPIAIGIWEDYIYWANHDSHVLTTNKFRASDHNPKVIVQDVGTLTAIAFEHKSFQKSTGVINPCQRKRCHLCLMNDLRYEGSCFCLPGYQADFTKMYCEESSEPHPFLLTADGNRILKVHLNSTGRPVISYVATDSMTNLVSLAYLSKKHEIVYSDFDTAEGKAYIGKVQGMDHGARSVPIIQDLISVLSIAVDETSSIVFWIDEISRSINVGSLDGSYQVKLPTKVVKPYGLAIDSNEGLLFYSELEAFNNPPIIRRCRLDGQFCMTLVSERLKRPMYLLAQGLQLFWSDYGLGEISTVDQWGEDRYTIVRTSGNPLSFTVHDDVLYWTEDGKTGILFKHLHSAEFESYIETQGKQLTGLITAIPYGLPQSACTFNNGGCEQICISIKRSLELSCLCSKGFHLHEDGKQCLGHVSEIKKPHCAGHVCKSDEHCLDDSKICDGEQDCDDASDEESCHSCSQDKYLCDKDRCIPNAFVCDEDIDCNDRSDEKPDLCPDKDDGKEYCIREDQICDGFEDCDDGRDEADCMVECDQEQFKCNDGECIDKLELCDEVENCENGEDEQACPTQMKCGGNEFKCYNGECIPKTAVCNKHSDCSSQEDEDQCENKCTTEEFQCEDGSCIASGQKCDGTKDCRDGSDEGSFCVKDLATELGGDPLCDGKICQKECDGFVCAMGQCIDEHKHCNGKPDCRDNSDEQNCHTMCKDFNPCSQKCLDTSVGIQCKCNPGFRLMYDELTCEDIDECKIQNGGCSHKCLNLRGSSTSGGLGFNCKCFDGFIRGHDYYSCRVRGKRPELLVSTPVGIKKIVMTGLGGESMVIPTKTPAMNIEFDIQRGALFWTDYKPNTDVVHLWKKGIEGNPKIIYTNKILESALDWLTGNMYVLHFNTNATKLAVLSTNGFVSTICPNLHYSFRSLTLHPQRGTMFWISGSQSTIVRASMDGRDQNILDEASRHIHTTIEILSIDVTTERLYWIDAMHGQLKSASVFDGEVYTFDLPTNARQYMSMKIFEGIAYMTSTATNTIQGFTTYKDKSKEVFHEVVTHPFDILVYHPLNQPFVRSVCYSMDCMICVTSAFGSHCLCPDEYKNDDNPRCDGMKISDFTGPESVVSTIPLELTTEPARSKKIKEVIFDVSSTTLRPKKDNTLRFNSSCPMVCLNGGECRMIQNIPSCRCLDGMGGFHCERKVRKEGKKTEEKSLLWVAGLVIGLVVLVIIIVAVWFFKYRRHHQGLMSSIRFKKQKKFVVCTQEDKDDFVPEISFGNPGFQDEIDEEADMHEDQDWWKKLINRSRKTVDSTFHSVPARGRIVPMDSINGLMKGDPQDPVMSDKVRLLQ